jgi:sugar lactone lactonase YvrE
MPRGAAVDDSGRLYVVDTSDHNVKVYNVGNSNSQTPAFIGLFGTEGQLDGTFEFPNGIATDTRAHIYVTDRENNRVQVWGY